MTNARHNATRPTCLALVSDTEGHAVRATETCGLIRSRPRRAISDEHPDRQTQTWGDRLGDTDAREFFDLVERWKHRRFQPTSLLLLDRSILRLVAAWPPLPKWIKPPEDERDNVWAWVRFDMRAWARLARVVIHDYDAVFEHLTSLGLILPDGTIPKEADQLILHQVLSSTHAATPRPRSQISENWSPMDGCNRCPLGRRKE